MTPQTYGFADQMSTLQKPTSTVRTADINLDHDIAGEFEAAVDQSKLESRNKYDFMNLGGGVPDQSQPYEPPAMLAASRADQAPQLQHFH